MRLIDADALKARLKIGTNTATYSDYCNGYCDARQVDLDAIDAAPTIEAEPVRHGRWNEKGHCGCCGYDMGSRVDKWTNVFTLQFCPNCGADMREGGADNG